MATHQFQPDLPPPVSQRGAISWLRENLFSSPINTIITLVIGYLVARGLLFLANWALIDANWLGSDRSACTGDGACWVFIRAWMKQFLYGFYDADQIWRVQIVYGTLALLLAALIYEKTPQRGKLGLFTLTLFPVFAYLMLRGGWFGLEEVGTYRWGGLLVTLVIAIVGIVASLPLGILLALGRRSKMPTISSLSTVYIELWRGVPLITVLFMASVMLPLFMSEGTETDKLLRALIGVVMFASAYMAEVIRGGLQAIPKGQYEAADALGLNYWKAMTLIILPQALRICIPSIVNTFIGLFKDTSLVLIIGMFDLLGIGQAANNDPRWLGYSTESYVFVGLVFWCFCFGMSRYSQFLERKLHTAHK